MKGLNDNSLAYLTFVIYLLRVIWASDGVGVEGKVIFMILGKGNTWYPLTTAWERDSNQSRLHGNSVLFVENDLDL